MAKKVSKESKIEYERPRFHAVGERQLFGSYGQQASPPGGGQQPGWGYGPGYGYGGPGEYCSSESNDCEQPEDENVRTPLYRLRDDGDHLVVDIELPGVRPEEIDLHVGRWDMSVTTDPVGTGQDDDDGYRRFHGTLQLPCKVEPDDTQVEYENGLLRVTLAKVQPPGRKHIRVGESAG